MFSSVTRIKSASSVTKIRFAIRTKPPYSLPRDNLSVKMSSCWIRSLPVYTPIKEGHGRVKSDFMTVEYPLGSSHKQHASRSERLAEPVKQPVFGLLRKIDHHIPTTDQIIIGL